MFQGLFTCPSVRVLAADIRLAVKQDPRRLQMPQRHRQHERRPSPVVLLLLVVLQEVFVGKEGTVALPEPCDFQLFQYLPPSLTVPLRGSCSRCSKRTSAEDTRTVWLPRPPFSRFTRRTVDQTWGPIIRGNRNCTALLTFLLLSWRRHVWAVHDDQRTLVNREVAMEVRVVLVLEVFCVVLF